jgi:hypothetical protein
MASQIPGTATATRGLATVALLKVNFDAGRDHIAMFEPFVTDTLCSMALDGANAEDVHNALRDRHKLTLPLNTLKTLLGRSVKQQLIRREAGRYFRTDKTPSSGDLLDKRAQVEARQQQLAEALIEFAGRYGIEVAEVDEALAMLLAFLEQFHVALALDATERIRPAAALDPESGEGFDRKAVVTARFIYELVVSGSPMAPTVEEMLEGFVLQNALLLKDISSANRRFQKLFVFFDSGMLFRALGLTGHAAEVATLEFIQLLTDTGARLNVFEPTIREMRSILSLYEERLATAQGRESLRPTPLTRHLLTTRQSPSDVRSQSALIERRLTQLGFNIRELPTHEAKFTLDEAGLGKYLAGGSHNDHSPRVVHDVNCVAGILTWRRGKTSESWDTAGAVFVTSSAATIDSVIEWYRQERGEGVPPIVHHLYLSNAAWLKRPASASKLKTLELMAVCAAALRPSRRAWERFLEHLRKLEKSNVLSSDEVTAILANGLTDGILIDAWIDEDSDAETLDEVVERVKESYQRKSDTEVRAARQEASEFQAEAVGLRARLRKRVETIASVASWTFTLMLAASFVAGTALSIFHVVDGSRPGVFELVLAAIPLAIAGLLSTFGGFNLKTMRATLADWLSERVLAWLEGAPRA